MTEATRHDTGAEPTPKPDFASCCREMTGAMPDCGPAMERMMSACGPMLEWMRSACGEKPQQTDTAAEDADSAGA
jgi:hypothetical protein